MKSIYRVIIYCIIVSILSISNGCKKSDSLESNIQLSGVKLFDDTLASGENPNIKISSGVNRLYMTYGRGSTFSTVINGMFLETISPTSNVVMATDIYGNLIWKNKLPEGLTAATPTEIADGGCLVAAADIPGYNPNIDNKKIYLFKYDSKGTQISVDSIVLPADYGDCQILTLDIVKISGNDILIYGTATDFGLYIARGFSIKFNANTGVQWNKPINFGTVVDPGNLTYIYSCIKTIDGGFMFMGIYNSPTQPGSPDYSKTIVLKTDANCDTLWTKWYDYLLAGPPNEIVRPSNIIQLANGDYFLCNNDIQSFDNVYKFNSFIYKLNVDGDSVGAFQLKGPGNSYCALIIEGNNQDITGLFNEYPGFLYSQMTPIFTPFNTQLYSFDTNLNFNTKSSIQTSRTDFMVSACKTPAGRIAMFGLSRTNNHESFVPALIIK